MENENPTAGQTPVPDALDLISRLIDTVEPAQLVAVHCMDEAAKVLFWNSGCAELYGIAPQDALGRPLASLLTFERGAEHAQALADAWRSGRAKPAQDWQVGTAGGRRLWVSSTLFPVAQDGKVQQVFCVDVDITARRLEEEALRAAGINFRQMYLRSSDAILMLQGDRVTDLNPAAMQLFKCVSREQMVGHRLHDFSTLQQSGKQLPGDQPDAEAGGRSGSSSDDLAASRSGEAPEVLAGSRSGEPPEALAGSRSGSPRNSQTASRSGSPDDSRGASRSGGSPDVRSDSRRDGRAGSQTDGQTDGRIDGRIDSRIDSRIDRRIDGQAGGQDHGGSDSSLRYDWRFLNCAGEAFWAEVLMTSISLDHGYLFYVVVRDITARKQAERTLHLAAQVFENCRDAIVLTDRAKRIIAVNRSFTLITGYPAEAMQGRPLKMRRDGVGADDFQHLVWQEMDATGHWQGEVSCRRRDGGLFPGWLSLTTIRDSADRVSNYMGMLSDITDRKRSEDHTRHLAEHDFLTDLPNRVLLLDRLSLALAAARRNHTMLAILFIDLDRFKEVNDTLGHHVGDELLKEIAQRLVKCVRGADTVSRQGGDEFLIILADIGGVDQAAHVAGSVLSAINQPFQLGPHALHVSGSVGISIYPNDGDRIEQLIDNADVAMYHAKESGRNGFQFFNADMHAQIAERVQMENGLRQALRKQEFELAFHAEIDIASGRPVGVEALLRWRHPELGLLRPERFMAAAEDAGLMIPIGNWVLQQACLSAQRWHDAGFRVGVAVNLSAAQFAQKNLLSSVGEALRSAGLAPASLELELTEAIIMKGGSAAHDTLQALHGLGVRLTIDDFGTGYSRLGYLKDYPVDKLKIDQSFVATLDGNTGVISAIIGMARSLNMLAIAEGVETQEQLDFLRAEGCDLYQGYLADAQVQAGPLGKLLAG
ncbi:EAL domain-containing protein [Pseudoduganella sp. LjRoot289]|uniref:sensor domain-containing protein n=1 Tax=Pseudoduganella sp. LjRoot289 TaxID=3342314 RepID=UPI003ECE24EF